MAISGEVRKDESELGRALTDLESLDKNGRIGIDEGVYIVGFEGIEEKTLQSIEREDPRYVDWLISANGIEDEEAREILSE